MSKPWKSERVVRPVNTKAVCIVDGDGMPTAWASATDVDHIVACVNACVGINPEAVPDVVGALRLCEIALGDSRIGTYNMDSPDWYEKVWSARDASRAALAKLEDVK